MVYNDGETEGLINIPQAVEPPAILQQPAETPEETPPEEMPEEIKPKRKHKLADLFETPQPEDNDINVDDLVTINESDVMGGSPDLSDLVDVPSDFIYYGHRKPKPKRFMRTNKRYQPPPGTGIMGMG